MAGGLLLRVGHLAGWAHPCSRSRSGENSRIEASTASRKATMRVRAACAPSSILASFWHLRIRPDRTGLLSSMGWGLGRRAAMFVRGCELPDNVIVSYTRLMKS